MVKFGELSATFAGNVTWTGPATLKVGSKSSLTVMNRTGVALSVTKQVQTTVLRDKGYYGIFERGLDWKVESIKYDSPSLMVVGPGRSQSFKGSTVVTKVRFKEDIKTEKRPIITYIGRETVDEGETDDQTNQADTDPPNPWLEDLGDNLGPFDGYTDQGDVVEGDESGFLGGRTGVIVLMIIVVLIAAGGSFAIRGLAMRRALGIVT